MTAAVTAEAAIAAQAAVEAYVAEHPAYDGSMHVVVGSGLYEAPSGVVIEHEGFLVEFAVRAAEAAVRAQGLTLVTSPVRTWEVRVP